MIRSTFFARIPLAKDIAVTSRYSIAMRGLQMLIKLLGPDKKRENRPLASLGISLESTNLGALSQTILPATKAFFEHDRLASDAHRAQPGGACIQ